MILQLSHLSDDPFSKHLSSLHKVCILPINNYVILAISYYFIFHKSSDGGIWRVMLQIILNFGILIILPAIFIYLLWVANFKSKFEWILDAFVTVLLTSWLIQAGNWSWFSYYIRFIWIAPLILALYFSWQKMRHKPFFATYSWSQRLTIVVYFVLVFVFGLYNVSTIQSYTVSDETLELAFPLKDGTYYIGQGGNNEIMNYHQIVSEQKYALDILKINSLGIRANGFYPKDLEKYHIYGDDLYSPCDGEIVAMANDLPDQIPPESDTENIVGNHVEIVCDKHDASIYMAHMQKGSVVVDEGEQVEVGQKLGKVGNSGNTTEPHLHMHAELDGEGIPITFNERFLVRNSLVK